MINMLLSTPTTRMLEQTLSFTEQRHNVLLADLANVSTPGYIQRDISVAEFQKSLRKAVQQKQASFNDTYEPESGETIAFEQGGSQVFAKSVEVPNSVPFHDRGIRSMEYLMSEMADNGLAHNMTAQFLKSRYDQIGRAISMRV